MHARLHTGLPFQEAISRITGNSKFWILLAIYQTFHSRGVCQTLHIFGCRTLQLWNFERSKFSVRRLIRRPKHPLRRRISCETNHCYLWHLFHLQRLQHYFGYLAIFITWFFTGPKAVHVQVYFSALTVNGMAEKLNNKVAAAYNTCNIHRLPNNRIIHKHLQSWT